MSKACKFFGYTDNCPTYYMYTYPSCPKCFFADTNSKHELSWSEMVNNEPSWSEMAKKGLKTMKTPQLATYYN